MKQLILKDIRLLRVYNIVLILGALLFGAIAPTLLDTVRSHLMYIITLIIGIYMCIISLTNNEVKSNAQPLLVSMPVKKFDIVKARYIVIFLYILLLTVLLYISSSISITLLNNSKYSFNINIMVITVSFIFIYLSINIPLQYYDIKKMQIFNMLIYVFIILLPNIYDKLGFSFINLSLIEKVSSVNFTIISIMCFTVSIIIYLISTFVSKKIYEKAEF